MCLLHLSITRSDNILHIQSFCTRCVSVLGKFKDIIHEAKAKAKDITHEAKAKAKDYRNCPRGSSRPRTCPRGLHHWTMACFCDVGRIPDCRDALQMLATIGARTAAARLTNDVGTGSSEQCLHGALSINFNASSFVAG